MTDNKNDETDVQGDETTTQPVVELSPFMRYAQAEIKRMFAFEKRYGMTLSRYALRWTEWKGTK